MCNSSALAVRFMTKKFIGEYQESKGIDNDETINRASKRQDPGI